MTIAGTAVDASHGRAATLPALLASAENPRASADAWPYWPGSHDALLPLHPRLPTSRIGMIGKLLRYFFGIAQVTVQAHAMQWALARNLCAAEIRSFGRDFKGDMVKREPRRHSLVSAIRNSDDCIASAVPG